MDTSGRRVFASVHAGSRTGKGRRETREREPGLVTHRGLGHLDHRGRNCFELRSRNAVETRSLANVVIRERFKLVYNTSETVRSGHGVERDGAGGAVRRFAGYADGDAEEQQTEKQRGRGGFLFYLSYLASSRLSVYI